MSYRTMLPVLTIAVAALAPSGCGGGGDNKATTAGTSNAKPATTAAGGGKATSQATVEIKNFKFGPPGITVKKGAKVTWKNADTTQHTATADNKSFNTGTLNPGQNKVVTLSKPGTYSYTCLFHPFMKGRVVVQ